MYFQFIVCLFVCLFSFYRFGRKKTAVGYMIAAGISALAVSFIPAGTNNTGTIAKCALQD